MAAASPAPQVLPAVLQPPHRPAQPRVDPKLLARAQHHVQGQGQAEEQSEGGEDVAEHGGLILSDSGHDERATLQVFLESALP